MEFPKIVSIGKVDISDRPVRKTDPENLLILPALETVIFPGVAIPITMSRPESKQLAKYAYENNLPIGVICQSPKAGDRYPDSADELLSIGTVCQVAHLAKIFGDTETALISALPRQRFKIDELRPASERVDGMLSARVTILPERKASVTDKNFPIVCNEIFQIIKRLDNGDNDGMPNWTDQITQLPDNEARINFICTQSSLQLGQKIALLSDNTLKQRANRLLEYLYQYDEMSGVLQHIKDQARESLSENQRRTILQHHYDAMHRELFGDDTDDIQTLSQKADDASMPTHAREIFDRELKKLDRFSPSNPDYAILQSYLDTVASLPWNRKTELNTDFARAREILDSDHYGMKAVKERILEQLALVMRNRGVHSPIVCLVGAPGVGKTSIGRAMAEATGRKYQRISLGGVHDESEIRGHRRTYIGAMMGRIMAAIQKSGVNNPLLMLDEIDKLSRDIKGDPAAALLEVLDPEQNSTFHDNYIDIDFDLSDVLFVATANTLDTLPRPLLDRMEIIEMPGYLPEEKIEIARRHLIPKIRGRYSLDQSEFDLGDNAIDYIIRHYTAESGVRQLEKRLAEAARKTLLRKMSGEDGPAAMPMDAQAVREILGLETYTPEDDDTKTPLGVATGLAWTAVGGETLQIETSISQAKAPKLTLTGNLGNIMKESAMISLQYIRANAELLGIDSGVFENNEIHIHVPEGAVPKDGPSAGITITSALVSLLTGRPIRRGIAMTGEMTLRGKVLPVGGIKEKILAAKRIGITDIYLSRRNRRHIEDIEPSLLDGLTFHYIDTYDDLLTIFETSER
ncbi:MAG: endopeptidase La [Clostridium sp.]|nr:endopeptidase La [Clostridium sp.]